jgi:hypothetical protein
MRTVITITLSTDTNTRPQAKENMAIMLKEISDSATKYGVFAVEAGSPAGGYTIKAEEQ